MLDEPLAAEIAAWRSGDCDPDDVAALDIATASALRGDADALAELRDAFAGSLEFGTAGLRGRMAPGPRRMNASVVRRAAFAIAHTVPTTQRVAVIGYDARHRSHAFAVESARVLAAAGWRPALLPRALPTPVLAFAVRHLSADLGIMVTASHNPPADNGYKVYLADGRQIVEPMDALIAQAIETAPQARLIPVDDGWRTLDESVVDAYLDTAARVVADGTARQLTVAHTALHGVATEVFAAAMHRAGFPAPIEVADQRDPDPDFPTVAFPNPEEPGAVDLLLECARAHGADVAIAHDPDADRCAVGIPTAHRWRLLTGDEVGALLGWWLLARPDEPTRGGTYATSLVSGTRLSAMAEEAGLPYATTLTGFKWISRVQGLAYGYEEALGYCVDPAHVADKDGITAALLICEMAADARARGTDLTGVLESLDRRFGVEATHQVSVRLASTDQAHRSAARIIADPPTEIGGLHVAEVIDLAGGFVGLPPTPGVLLRLDGGEADSGRARVIVRPSGTEPKVKAYLLVHRPPDEDIVGARAGAERTMRALETAVSALLGEPVPDADGL